jgi:hypothetical protein
VGTVNVTVRFNEEELGRLDDLAQRMNKTRSDVIRDLVNRFDEVLRQEVEKERKKWMMIGFVGALESVILDPEVILRFVRRNVDVLGYPDFLIGMVRVRNRVVVLSHHDKVGNQLLQLVRAKVENEVRREEAEIEREEDDEGDVGGDRLAPAYTLVHRGVLPRTPHVAPVATKHKLVSSNKAIPPTAKPTAISTVGKSVVSGGGGNAKPAGTATVPKNQKASNTGYPLLAIQPLRRPRAPAPRLTQTLEVWI